MGNQASSPAASPAPSGAPAASAATSAAAASPPSECPMHKENMAPAPSPPSECPMHKESAQSSAPADGWVSECPSNAATAASVNAATAGINPLNQEAPPNQRPAPDQPFSLPTDRVKSSIPKADSQSGETWVYPSQQMFWNAMLRKGWRWRDDDVTPDTMRHIIHIHNANNEEAWREVLKWEALHAKECGQPKLKSFGGKAKDFSPRARIRGMLGYEMPFDRY